MAHVGFSALAAKLAQRPGVTNPGALAASIGDNKYGKGKMAQASHSGKALSDKQALKRPSAAQRRKSRKRHSAPAMPFPPAA